MREKTGMVADACNSSMWKAEAGGLLSRGGQDGPQNEVLSQEKERPAWHGGANLESRKFSLRSSRLCGVGVQLSGRACDHRLCGELAEVWSVAMLTIGLQGQLPPGRAVLPRILLQSFNLHLRLLRRNSSVHQGMLCNLLLNLKLMVK